LNAPPRRVPQCRLDLQRHSFHLGQRQIRPARPRSKPRLKLSNRNSVRLSKGLQVLSASIDKVLTPRRVGALREVKSIACGAHHTLALCGGGGGGGGSSAKGAHSHSPSSSVFAFGRGSNGELGCGMPRSPCPPRALLSQLSRHNRQQRNPVLGESAAGPPRGTNLCWRSSQVTFFRALIFQRLSEVFRP